MRKDWFRRYDFLNVPTSLSYKNEYFYATNVGAALTIFFFFIIVAVISYEIILLHKKSSFTLISNQYTDLFQPIDFSETPFLFQMINGNGKNLALDSKLFELVAYNMEQTIKTYENGTRKRKVTNTKIELEQCDKIYKNETEYAELNLSRYICFKPGQNLTAFGLLGDLNKPYKGIRIYINKCSGENCYDNSVIEKQFHNAKFFVNYLSLSSNMFNLKSQDIKYQIFTKFCSLSPNILKKVVFTFDLGRFYLFNNILFGNNISFNYLIGNDYSMDVDLDPTSTLSSNEYTIAYISFHYGGIILETRKQVLTVFESLSIVGNIFNIILTIFKVINSYYSNKILFVDIFNTVFFAKEKSLFNIKDNNNIHLNNLYILKKSHGSENKKNLDISEQIDFDVKSNNKKISFKQISNSNKMIMQTGNKSMEKRSSKNNNENKKLFTETNIMYYYMLPFWILRRKKTFNRIYSIKDRICGYFSIEKINELIKFKENFENKSLRSKMSNSELIKINNINNENLCLNDGKNNNI